MREIKFRAFDEKNKIMHNDFQFVRSGTQNGSWILFVSDKQPLSDYDKWIKNPFAVQQFKIMQYTGIKDKSGKEIYEGDIIAVGMNIKGFNGHILTVRYEDDLAAFNLSIVFDYCDEKLLEVIGNMYENPELIEVKK